MRLVEREIARSPHDMDVREWRARVLAWSGELASAEREYLEVLETSRKDPDKWLGLAGVYAREGKQQESLRALDVAQALDPKRADLHAARARALRDLDKRAESLNEFRTALRLDPRSAEARAGLLSLRSDPKHELRLGNDNDVFNFTSANHAEGVALISRWTAGWATSMAGNFYQRGGVSAEKFVGSLTRKQPQWGAVTIGGATARDNAVIPKNETFFDLDRGWKTGETGFVRGIELTYGQHWYWYRSARILTLNGTAITYFPREWTLIVAASGVRNAFSGTGVEWKPSGTTRLSFPLAAANETRISGNLLFAAGTEDFAQVDQIGRFASQTYGGGVRLRLSAQHDVSAYAAYQKRAQARTDTSFGFSYGFHF
jgi:tetratricopeptide (TPR) repeat protein